MPAAAIERGGSDTDTLSVVSSRPGFGNTLIEAPQTTTKSINTMVKLKEGQTVAIGGLITTTKENSKQIGFLPIERAWVDKVELSGFADTFRTLHPDEVKYSWWDQKTSARTRNVGWRIDYFFVNKELQNQIKHADILDTFMGSDHAPIVLDIDL